MGHIGIVVLNWNNFAATRRCLVSLQRTEGVSWHVYLVDNASSDGSAEQLTHAFQNYCKITVIRNHRNFGFAGGCNTGIRAALEAGADLVVLLNNDCVILESNWLRHGLVAMESYPRTGIVGGKIYNWPPDRTIWSTGGYIKRLGGEVHIGHKEIDRGQHNKRLPREFISGACMLINRDVINTIGYLPQAYFFGKEEWEYSIRAGRAGFRILYEPAMRIWHEASSSHDATDATYIYNGAVSRILFRRRNFSRLYFLTWYVAYWVYANLVWDLAHIVRRRHFSVRVPAWQIKHALRRALRDGRRVKQVDEDMLQRYRNSRPLGSTGR